MKSTTRSSRKLRTESLESRQLLHGGALFCEPPPATDIAASVFARMNTNDDTVLAADDGIAGRVLERLADADTDGNGVSQAELTSHIETRIAERQAGNGDTRAEARAARQEARQEARQARRAARQVARAEAAQEAPIGSRMSNVIRRLRSLGRFRISQGELPSQIATRIAERSSRRADRLDAAFERLDKNDDGSVTADEVSNRRWERISEAAGSDDAVTQDELREHLEAKRAEPQAGNGDTRAEARAARQEAREARQGARAEAAQAETTIGSRMSNVIQRVRGLGRFGFRR